MFCRASCLWLFVLFATSLAIRAQPPSQKVVDEFNALRKSGLSEKEKLNKIFDLTYEYSMLEFPEYATFTGYPGQNDRWTDHSEAAKKRREVNDRMVVKAVVGIDPTGFTEEDLLNYQLFRNLVESGLESNRFPSELLPLNQMDGPQIRIAQLLTIMPLGKKAQVEDYLARLVKIPELLSQQQFWLEKGLKAGVTPPQITLKGVPAQIKSQIPEKPFDSPLIQRLANLGGMEGASGYQARAEKIFTEKVKPAFEAFHDFIANQYIPNCRTSIGLSDLPNGKSWYSYRVKESTTTDLTPEEIHQIGLNEVKRIRAEMEKVIKASGFEGDFKAFTEFLRTDPQFYFTRKEDLLMAYRDIAKRADAQLVQQFGKLPRLPYGVTPVPAYSEKTATTAYYNPGSMEAGRPGYFFANTYDLKSRPKWEMEALTLHEAVPGHHLQISLGQELENVPRFRKFSTETAFVEGWGLYSESLGEDMGFYQDPYSKFGQLTYEMWRAVRLVVDTGMHALGWSRQKAIDYFIANTGKAEHDIVVEVDRYIVWPGQALAYKIGELKIKELRAYAEKALGSSFDVRKFHDRVLSGGALPLEVLENRIKSWVEDQKKS